MMMSERTFASKPKRRTSRSRVRFLLVAGFVIPLACGAIAGISPAHAGRLLLGASLGGGLDDRFRIGQFEALTGRNIDIVSVPMPWAGSPGFISFNGSVLQWATAVSSDGALPMVSWEPERWNGAASPAPGACPNQLTTEPESAPAIAFLHRYAREVAAFGKPILLRPMHEMNMAGWVWSVGHNPDCGDISAADFITAWRRIVSIFRAEGARNAKFVWCVNWSSFGTLPGPVTVTYPGDAYVDYAAIDGYNFGGRDWHSFDEIFRVPYAQIVARTRRPILIAEWASAETGGSKAAWIRSAFASIKANHYPQLAGLVWFNETIAGQPPWVVDSSPAAARAYRAAVRNLP
jgi:Glycosyl hydrolase family 26